MKRKFVFLTVKLDLFGIYERAGKSSRMNTKITFNKSQISYPSTNHVGAGAFSNAVKRPLVLIAQSVSSPLNELLDLYNLKVVEAQSGEEAVDFTVAHRPDLIVIDGCLTGLGGFEVIRLIRSISSLSKIPIIFLSDYPERMERYRAFEAGCDAYLAKPLDLDRVDFSLEKFLFRTHVNAENQ